METFKAGKWINQYEYKSFRPEPINRPLEIYDNDIHYLLNEASRLVGELNAYSRLIPNVDFFIHMHITKEATTSSRIEGTKTEFNEALMDESEISPERKNDWQEVRNYTFSMNSAISELKGLPLSMRLLKKTHSTLLSDVRGENKLPGEIRSSQNWIGGSNPSNALFVPPHHEELPELISDLEKFIHNDSLKINPLIMAALAHYQFETIHPFLDGNGRIGRLLITLILVDKKILSKPTLYLSDFFARNKGAYYDSLTMVRQTNDIRQWFKFFLTGVKETSENSIKTFEKIIALRSKSEESILHLGRKSQKAKQMLQYFYSRPIADAKDIIELLGTSHQTAIGLLKDFVELGILKEVVGRKRNRLFDFREYLEIFG